MSLHCVKKSEETISLFANVDRITAILTLFAEEPSKSQRSCKNSNEQHFQGNTCYKGIREEASYK